MFCIVNQDTDQGCGSHTDALKWMSKNVEWLKVAIKAEIFNLNDLRLDIEKDQMKFFFNEVYYLMLIHTVNKIWVRTIVYLEMSDSV